MASLNRVFLIGNLTRDPQVKFLPNESCVCDIGLAVNRRWKDKDGTPKEETTFVDCSAFAKTAETMGQYLKKGSPVWIEGRLKLDAWEDKDGQKRTKMRVVVEGFQFLAQREPGDHAAEPAAAPTPRPQRPIRPAQEAHGEPDAMDNPPF